MKSSATMCRLARAMAVSQGPRVIGNLIGYALTTPELRKLYTRNGFQNLDTVIFRHTDGWVSAQMVFRVRENIVFYLDQTMWEDVQAYRSLETAASEKDTVKLTMVGWMP